MKKLLVSLLLVVILIITFSTPAFADDGNGNMGGKNADTLPPNPPWQNPQGWVCGLRNALGHLGWGSLIIAPMMSDGKNAAHFAYGWYAMSRSIWCIANGQPPAKPHWAGGP